MKALIKVSTASKAFTEDQLQILRRISNVLTEHNLSVELIYKQKVRVTEFKVKKSA
jgi:hypothetical protein